MDFLEWGWGLSNHWLPMAIHPECKVCPIFFLSLLIFCHRNPETGSVFGERITRLKAEYAYEPVHAPLTES